ncbi:hypothetical protein KKG61_03120 [bacterium]|nr:hypothetical protein [bacterium]MBU2462408.1 hypothetical protein [bacterium]
MTDSTDPIDFIKAIHKEAIRYLLIGRQAMIAYGIPVATIDYDLYIDGGDENTKRFLEIAERFDLFPSRPLERMKESFMFKLENDITIDVFRCKKITNQEGETISFEEIYKNRRTPKDEKTGAEVNLPSIDDLIKLKKTGRYKDIIDVQYLEKLKEMQREEKI